MLILKLTTNYMFCTIYSLDTQNYKFHSSHSIAYLIIWKLGICMSFPASIPQQSNHSPQSKIIVILLTQLLFCQIIYCVDLHKENLVFTHVHLKGHVISKCQQFKITRDCKTTSQTYFLGQKMSVQKPFTKQNNLSY